MRTRGWKGEGKREIKKRKVLGCRFSLYLCDFRAFLGFKLSPKVDADVILHVAKILQIRSGEFKIFQAQFHCSVGSSSGLQNMSFLYSFFIFFHYQANRNLLHSKLQFSQKVAPETLPGKARKTSDLNPETIRTPNWAIH